MDAITSSGSTVPVFSSTLRPASRMCQRNATPVASSTRRVASVISGPVPSPGISVTSYGIVPPGTSRCLHGCPHIWWLDAKQLLRGEGVQTPWATFDYSTGGANSLRGAILPPGCGREMGRQSRAAWLYVTTVRGKSELHRAGCWLTASGGDPKDSATETYRPTRAWLAAGKGEMVR